MLPKPVVDSIRERVEKAGSDLIDLLSKVEGGNITGRQVKVVIHDVYELLLGKYRPLLGALIDLLPDKLVAEFKPLVLATLPTRKFALSDQDVRKLFDEVIALRAAKRRRHFEAYTNVEFTNDQAFALLMADITVENTTSAIVVKNIANAIPSSSKKKKSAKKVENKE